LAVIFRAVKLLNSLIPYDAVFHDSYDALNVLLCRNDEVPKLEATPKSNYNATKVLKHKMALKPKG